MALNLELSGGRHGASARIELRERPAGLVVLFALRGWLGRTAVLRLGRTLDVLGERGIEQLLLDCSQVRHIDYRMVPRLVEALGRFEARAGSVAVCGLSRYLQDLFRLSGCDGHLHEWPSAAEVLATAQGSPRGSAS